jgi:hypothetical protein
MNLIDATANSINTIFAQLVTSKGMRRSTAARSRRRSGTTSCPVRSHAPIEEFVTPSVAQPQTSSYLQTQPGYSAAQPTYSTRTTR